MIVFHSDLDNTLIYSYKREIGAAKVCVERYQGREISFMSKRSQRLLREAARRVLFVPTTTRTVEQYQRIDLGIGTPEYALVCNGGVLLVNGVEERDWYEESQALTADCQTQLHKAQRLLTQDENVNFEIRNIRELFLFTKSADPGQSVRSLRERLEPGLVDVFSNGVKVYVLPKTLSKGNALKRFRKRVQAERVIAAGDSEFDLSMLREADQGFAPAVLALGGDAPATIVSMGERKLFSEEVLECVCEGAE